MSATINFDQKVRLTLAPKNAAGEPAEIENPVWSSSVPEIVRIDPTEDPNSVFAVAVGPGGAAQVACSCDADIGEGERLIVGILDIEVINTTNEAVTVELVAGEPEPQ